MAPGTKPRCFRSLLGVLIIIFVFLAAAIIIGLAWYAIRLLLMLRRQQSEIEKVRVAEEQKQLSQVVHIVKSVQVISANVIDENLNLSEATLRCKMLLDGLLMSEEQRRPFRVLDIVFEQIKEFDTHNARLRLSAVELAEQDEAREIIEQTHEQALRDCFKQLRHFEWPIRH